MSLFCFVQLYRKDCETFCTVVKMLVAKEPSLDHLLQAPLEENLLEIKQRCLDDLRHFVKELDEVLEATGRKTLNMQSQNLIFEMTTVRNGTRPRVHSANTPHSPGVQFERLNDEKKKQTHGLIVTLLKNQVQGILSTYGPEA